jgi:hypothetical protein
MESEFLLFPSTGVVGFLPYSIDLPVNKPDERAGRFLAPLLEAVNSEQSEVLEAGMMLRRVGGSDMLRSPHLFGLIGPQPIEERERLR